MKLERGGWKLITEDERGCNGMQEDKGDESGWKVVKMNESGLKGIKVN